MDEMGFDADELDVQVSELLVATAERDDELLDQSIGELLRLLRDRMRMDVVFVAEFTEGRRVFRHVEHTPGANVISPGEWSPLEQSWCQYVVDCRLPKVIPNAAKEPAVQALSQPPFPIGAHLSTPIRLGNGSVYGTLCCFSFTADDGLNQRHLRTLQHAAQLVATKLARRKPLATAD